MTSNFYVYLTVVNIIKEHRKNILYSTFGIMYQFFFFFFVQRLINLRKAEAKAISTLKHDGLCRFYIKIYIGF